MSISAPVEAYLPGLNEKLYYRRANSPISLYFNFQRYRNTIIGTVALTITLLCIINARYVTEAFTSYETRQGWTILQDRNGDRVYDYYRRPGILQIDPGLPRSQKARFVPLEYLDRLTRNEQTVLGTHLRLGDGFDILQDYNARQTNKAAATRLAFLKNKTVLLIGDSVDRKALDFFCKHLLKGSSLSHNRLHAGPHDLSMVEDETAPGHDEYAEPHRCILPLSFGNTTIWSLMLNGVTSNVDDWSHKKHSPEPRVYKDKILLFKTALDNLGRRPDFVLLHSILWDLATFNIRDAKAEAPAADMLSLENIKDFREITRDLIKLVKQLWPDAKLFYRLQHAVKATSGDWYMKGLQGNLTRVSRAPMDAVKIAQLNEVVYELVQDAASVVRPFDLKHALQEYTVKDELHPKSVGLLIYTQMLLYYLKQST